MQPVCEYSLVMRRVDWTILAVVWTIRPVRRFDRLGPSPYR
jgi:hypothetical protein